MCYSPNGQYGQNVAMFGPQQDQMQNAYYQAFRQVRLINTKDGSRYYVVTHDAFRDSTGQLQRG